MAMIIECAYRKCSKPVNPLHAYQVRGEYALYCSLQCARRELHRVFEVGDDLVDKVCPVCEGKFQRGELVVLQPIQKTDVTAGTVQAIPIHEDCFWVNESGD